MLILHIICALVAGAQNGGTTCSVSSGVSQTFPSQGTANPSMVMAVPPNSVAGPTTNLNIGMDYWGGPTPPPVATGRAKLPTVQPPGAVVPSTRDGIPSDLWIQVCFLYLLFFPYRLSVFAKLIFLYVSQDERELKRQRRKQSNRESARRSRLRKQVRNIGMLKCFYLCLAYDSNREPSLLGRPH